MGRVVLDPCCGSKMFWFDKEDPRVIFGDKRTESHILCDGRLLNIAPDVELDFTALSFNDNQFHHVVFDPPHLLQCGETAWIGKKYGILGKDWRDMLRKGFAECFRVLAPNGTLIFKWNEHSIPVSQILALTPERPLVGQQCGKNAKTHWMVFLKAEITAPATSPAS